MLRQMTDIVPDKIPYGVLLCVLAVLFLFFRPVWSPPAS